VAPKRGSSCDGDGVLGHCRSCPAQIRWAVTTKGKRIPLDLDPRDDGNVTLELIDGVWHATVHGKDAVIPAGTKRFISHFATCVNAARHRRPKNASSR
jgi:hypothetical protein